MVLVDFYVSSCFFLCCTPNLFLTSACTGFSSFTLSDNTPYLPFLGCPSFLGSNTSLDIYSFNLSTLATKPSTDLLVLLESTLIPIVLAKLGFSPAFFSSSRVNPFPSLTSLLYLWVGQRTWGLSLSTGRGNYWRAFSLLLRSLRFLRAGWLNHVLTHFFQCLRRCGLWIALLCLTIFII